MRILIVGNDPSEIGGVANYTRPLATKYAEMGYEVFYLYSGAYTSKYDLRLKPYIRIINNDFPFESAEIYNSTCLPFNFGNPQRDVTMPDMERIIEEYIDRIVPTVMHVHSRLGLPFSINRLAYERGITVLNTIHVYGYICQKRVMIDNTGAPCRGPFDLIKCAACTGNLDIRTELKRARIRSFKEFIRSKSARLYALMQITKRSTGVNWSPGVTPATPRSASREGDPGLARQLLARLKDGVDALNCYSHRVLCVSENVKQTLMKFGVNEEKLLVQHIGSVIAEHQNLAERPLHEPIVIGNIGGVNYYKGTHVLLDAIGKLKRRDFIVRIYGKYNVQYVADLMRGREDLQVEFTGRYRPEDLPVIMKQIDIMVLPSICNDTAPQTIFESFSYGIPIIASKIGGFPDFITHGKNGRLFEANNPDDLANQINTLLDNRKLIIEYKTTIPRLKTISKNAAELIELYSLCRSRNSLCQT